jgi:hypothetical protein
MEAPHSTNYRILNSDIVRFAEHWSNMEDLATLWNQAGHAPLPIFEDQWKLFTYFYFRRSLRNDFLNILKGMPSAAQVGLTPKKLDAAQVVTVPSILTRQPDLDYRRATGYLYEHYNCIGGVFDLFAEEWKKAGYKPELPSMKRPYGKDFIAHFNAYPGQRANLVSLLLAHPDLRPDFFDEEAVKRLAN